MWTYCFVYDPCGCQGAGGGFAIPVCGSETLQQHKPKESRGINSKYNIIWAFVCWGGGVRGVFPTELQGIIESDWLRASSSLWFLGCRVEVATVCAWQTSCSRWGSILCMLGLNIRARSELIAGCCMVEHSCYQYRFLKLSVCSAWSVPVECSQPHPNI